MAKTCMFGEPVWKKKISSTYSNVLKSLIDLGTVVIIFWNFYAKQEFTGKRVSRELENT